MIIKTSGFPEFEIPDEALTELPYITSLFKMTENGATVMYLMVSDKPMYYISNLLDLMSEGSYSGGGLYFAEVPSNYVMLTVASEDGVNVEMEPVGDSSSAPVDEFMGNLLFIYLLISMSGVGAITPTYSNYDIHYAAFDDTGEFPVIDEKIAYIGDTSDPIMLSAPSSAFQSIADFVRSSLENSDLMNSTTLLEKLKTITSVNSNITMKQAIPDEDCVSLLNGNFGTNFYNAEVTKVKYGFFSDNTELVSVDLPEVVETDGYVFQDCSSLVDVNLPKLTTAVGGDFQYCTSLENIDLPNFVEATAYGMFIGCTALKNVNLPKLTDVSSSMFSKCSSLESLVFPSVTYMGNGCFGECYNLKSVDFHQTVTLSAKYPLSGNGIVALIFRNEVMSADDNISSSTLYNTPIESGTGYIYVPRSLVNSYKSHAKWSLYASQFRPLEDYTVDGTRMGELDWSKIETATGEQ